MNVLRWIVDRFPLGDEDDDGDQADAAQRTAAKKTGTDRGRVGRVRHGQGGPTR